MKIIINDVIITVFELQYHVVWFLMITPLMIIHVSFKLVAVSLP